MSDLALLGGVPVRTRPFPSWPRATEDSAELVLNVLASGNWGGFPFPGPKAQDVAQRFAQLHGADYGCCVANGTVSIYIALLACGLEFGSEVLVPAYTWEGTAMAVLMAGGVPILVDVDPDTYTINPESARAAVTDRTRAILPVHLAMFFADMDALRELALDHDLWIVEDCAHAHGGQWRGRGAGSIGDLGCFSFQSSKLMASGEGGMILTGRLDLFERVQSLVNCGRASSTDRFRERLAGGNYRMTEFQAAILSGQLDRLLEQNGTRAANAAILDQALAALPGIRTLPSQPHVTRQAIYQYVFEYRQGDSSVSRDMFVAALEAEGIPCDGRFYEPLNRSDLFRPDARTYPQLVANGTALDFRGFHCPVAERAAYRESVWIPHFVFLGTAQDMRDIAAAVEKVMGNLEEMERADPALAAHKSMSRAERPIEGRGKNY